MKKIRKKKMEAMQLQDEKKLKTTRQTNKLIRKRSRFGEKEVVIAFE